LGITLLPELWTLKSHKIKNSKTTNRIIIMSSPSSFNLINQHCDAAIFAVHQLEEVKNIITKYETDHEALAANEKTGLEVAVSRLRLEKGSLKKAIVELKMYLHELGDELTDAQNQVLAHVYYTTAGSTYDSTGGGGTEDDSSFDMTNDGSEVAEVSHTDFNIAGTSDFDSLALDGTQDTFFQSQTSTRNTQATPVVAEAEFNNARGKSVTPLSLGDDFTQEGIGPFNAQETSFSIDTVSVVSTASSSVRTTMADNSRRRISKKVTCMSPKKWRRMIRTHRLQSILLTN
jgi:hypothetical protein